MWKPSTPTGRTDPGSVTGEWQEFFGSLGDEGADVAKAAAGASWARKNWPIHANGELVSALDGHWSNDEIVSEKKVSAKIAEKAAD